MTIRSKLWVSAVIEVGLVILIGVVLAISFLNINRANMHAAKAVEINEAITQMRFITFESLLHHDDRALEQWQLKYDDITNLLNAFPTADADEQAIVHDMRAQHTDIKVLFDRLVTSYTDPSLDQNALDTRDFQERLATQLLIKQQAKITDASKLTALNHQEIQVQQMQIGWWTSAIIVVMLLVTIANSLAIMRAVTPSLTKLQKGAEAISAGKFGYRIKPGRRDEFGRLASAFNSMANSLEQVDKLKSQFITVAAHQLRTPSSVIRWTLEELLGGEKGRLSPRQKASLKTIHAANAQIIARVDDLLTATDINERGIKLEKKQDDPAALLKTVVDELSDACKNKHITLSATYPSPALPTVQVDPTRLCSVFRKYIENALIYTPEHGRIQVRLMRRGKHLYFEVTDTGIGIPKTEQVHISERFFRASNALTMMTDASGLGLYISRHIIRAHGGEVGFKSLETKGSTFWFEIPMQLRT